MWSSHFFEHDLTFDFSTYMHYMPKVFLRLFSLAEASLKSV
jgi:hypothetical protein